ncbi:protein ENL [Agrilus planipennis]|uniref:Protein ENL n=1 Tax=Agrilus planipennis TaxID=224129 RepID=A0A1W4WRX3_AGRPL|nr:protein ENL [Agrilus planipennis]
MSIKITLEIGHEAAIRTKRTPEGFTHDWEVFIRGCDNANIQNYIEKVIFHLHETFQKPKRVVKEPPYSVKESGYAGFTLPIEIYLRNKDEPKKITFNYDLTLQPTGPAICKLQKEKFVFNNPSEEFRHKLLKGGGMIVNSATSDDINHEKSSHPDDKIQLVSKPKLSIGENPRKHKTKIEEPRIFNSFQELFGTPITKTTTKVFSEPKSNSNNISKDDNNKLSTSKHEKDKEKVKKHSSHKSKDKDKVKEKSKAECEKKSKSEKNREDKKEKRDKDEKNREKKEKKEKSPRPRSSSPKHLSPKTPPSPVIKQDEKKENFLKEKERKLEKSEQKLQAIESSNKKKERYDKDTFEKRNKEKSFIKSSDSKENKVNNKEKDKGEIKKEKDIFVPPHSKIEKREKNKEVIKEPKTPTIESEDLIKKDKSERNDEKKHKHKKKDKDKKDKEKKKESKSKSHKSEESAVNLNSSDKNFENKEIFQAEEERSRRLKNEYSTPKFTEKSPELKKEVNSDSSVSSPVSVHEEIHLPPPEPIKDELDSKPETLTKHKKEKKEKKSKGDKESKKLKRKSEVKNENEPVEKIKKDETKENEKEDNQHKEPDVKEEVVPANNEVKTDEEPAPQEDEDAGENDENREAYMNRLKDLQQRIMTLEDNDELQKVVELIAKTGKYEVSARTFDFDLCLLERSTIRKLQEFFDI